MNGDIIYTKEISSGGHSMMLMLAPLTINFKPEVVVAIYESMDDLVIARRNIIWTTVAVVGLMLLIIVPIYVLTVSQTIAPIRELSRASMAVAEGQLDQHLPVKTGDEVGELSASFNKMVDDLRQYRKDIEHWNKTLEDRVAQRTRQLAATQAKLVRSEKLAAVGELAAGVAHELNNPLAGIYAFLQVFADTIKSRSLSDLSEEEVKDFQDNLVHVEREIQRCKSIIGSLLTLAHPTREEFAQVDLNKVVTDTLALMRGNLTKAGIDVEMHFEPDIPAIKGDANALQQVLVNIVVNARKAMPDGGELTILTSMVKNDHSVCVSVSDTGGGIDEEMQARIFDPFFTTSKPGEGIGLGLSISYGIIRDHNGEIQVQSISGEGATFSIILPVTGADHLNDGPEIEDS
jgi:two-component system NtrC family sensor kinase